MITVIVYEIAWICLTIITIAFFVWIWSSLGSRQISDQISKYPKFHFLWGCIALVGILTLFGIDFTPVWVDRWKQRQQLHERITAAGGWQAVRLGCESIATNYPNGFHSFHNSSYTLVRAISGPGSSQFEKAPIDSDALPSAIPMLKAQQIDYDPFKPVLNESTGLRIPVVRIKLFGMYSTGGQFTPYFGLAVPLGSNASRFTAPLTEKGVRSFTYRQVADGIFEVY